MCKSLPRPSELSGVILLELKRKLQYVGYQYCELVRPEFLSEALDFLKENNNFYQNVEINLCNLEKNPVTVLECSGTDEGNNVSENDTEVGKKKITDDIMGDSINSEISSDVNAGNMENCDEEEIDDPQNQYRSSVNETC